MTLYRSMLMLFFLFMTLFVFSMNAFATLGKDEDMCRAANKQAGQYADAFEDASKAWSKAAPGSPEADSLAKQGADSYAALEKFIQEKMPEYEESLKWYKEQGSEYAKGLDYMERETRRLKRYLNDAKELALYKHLHP